MQIRGWQLWGANGRPPSNCRRPVARRNLRAVLIGADADLGHDEFHQFRPWRIRHARHVCRIPGRGLAAWRPGGIHPCRGLCSACAWHCDLSFAYPSCHSRSDACADSLDLRTCIIASLYGVLHLLREFCVAAANLVCRHGEFRRRIFAGGTARRRRHCDRAYGGAAHLAAPLDHRQQAVGRRGRRAAAMLMGIRPHRMQMLAWGLSAGALMATAYPWSPSVGETFGLIAFVVVALCGFGSVLGSLYAGLIIGLIQAVSAFWLGAIYKDIVVYGLFVALLWFRPQGLMGKA